MNAGDVLNFSHDLYKAQEEWQERLSERNKFFLTALSLLGGASMAFASRDYFKDIHQNGAVLFYYVVLLLTWMSLLLVLVLIIRAELPRDYAELGSFTEFLTWRDAYAQELQEAGYSDAQSFEIANQKLGEEIVKKLAEAERVNRQTNVDRQELGNETLTGLIASGICVIVQIGLERMLSLERVVTW